jgi:hypothetical protein
MEMAGATRPFPSSGFPGTLASWWLPRAKPSGAYSAGATHLSRYQRPAEDTMSKGLDKKKEQKKKPAKSLKEKRAEKSEKKAGKN